MRKLTFLLAFSTVLLSACFRGAATDSPTLSPADSVAQNQPSPEVTALATEEAIASTEEVAVTPTIEVTPTETEDPNRVVLYDMYGTAVAQGVGQGGALEGASPSPTAEEAIPIGEGQTTVLVVVSPTPSTTLTPSLTSTATTTNTNTPTNTPTATATITQTPSNTPNVDATVAAAVEATFRAQPTATATATATISPTATETLANSTTESAQPTGTRTTVPLTAVPTVTLGARSSLLEGQTTAKASEPALGTGGGNPAILGSVTPPAEVAQVQVTPNTREQTATAVIGGATATQAFIEAQGTIAAGGQPPAVDQGGQAIQPGVITATPVVGQITPQVIVATTAPVGPTADCQYVVGLGDTLGAIANRYNLTINEIATVNNIVNPDLITAGYPITIPGCGRPLATATPAVAAGQGGAIIAPTANPLLPNRGNGFQVGGTNQANPTAGQGGAGGATDNSQGPFIYTIIAGDRIYQLAITYGVTVYQILAANPQIVDMNYIVEGQQITIPGPPVNATTTTTTTQPAAGQGGVIIVTPTPQVQQPAILQPTLPLPFTPTFTPAVSG